MARRDLRSGQQTARAALEDGGVRLSIRWGEPNAGVNTRAYLLECQSLASPRDRSGYVLPHPFTSIRTYGSALMTACCQQTKI